MSRAALVLIAALAATLFYVGPGQKLLPGSFRLQVADAALTALQTVPAEADPGSHAGGAGAATGTGTSAGNADLPPGNVIVEVTTQPSARPEQGYVLETQVRAVDGKPVNDVTVRFYETVELFGQREMLIASLTTDGQGRASAIYLPARIGAHGIVVRFEGTDKLQPAIGRMSFEASVAAPTYQVEPMPLSGFAKAVPYAVGVVVLTVWGLIALALFGTARGVKTGARITRKGDTA